MRSVVKRLGGFRVVDSVNIHTTHVVCGNNRRTLNVLKAIGRGCWLLSIEWVRSLADCLRRLSRQIYVVSEQCPSVCYSVRTISHNIIELGRYHDLLMPDGTGIVFETRYSIRVLQVLF